MVHRLLLIIAIDNRIAKINNSEITSKTLEELIFIQSDNRIAIESQNGQL